MKTVVESSRPHEWRWGVAFFVVTYLVTALVWIPILQSGQALSALSGRLQLLAIPATIVPSLVAIILSSIEGGRRDLSELLSQAGRWRFGLGWYVLAILLMPLVWVLPWASGDCQVVLRRSSGWTF